MKNRYRYLLLLTMAAIFALSAIPASALFGGGADAALQTEEGTPIARNLEVTTYQDIPYTGQLLPVDEEEGLTFSIVEQPRKGTVALEGDAFIYTPEAGKTGKDSFTYAITDAGGLTSQPATVSITIEKRRTQVTYSDMEGRTGYASAIALAENGVYVGRQVGSDWFFDPDAQVSRTEFLAMAMAAAGTEVDPSVSLTGFADDAAIPTWAKSYASAAARDGLIEGVATQEGIVFRGENAITLEEAAAIMDRLLDVADVYLEDSQQAWADQAVANMESVQVVAAGSFGSDQVSQPVTMEQAAHMLAAGMELLESREESGGFLFGWF